VSFCTAIKVEQTLNQIVGDMTEINGQFWQSLFALSASSLQLPVIDDFNTHIS
jgi:hypothetical protein